jgi:hypothetical protein
MPLLLACCIALCLSCGYRPVGDLNTATQQIKNRLFDPKKRIEVQLISGSCLVKAGPEDAIHVRVVHRYGPAEKFATQFTEEGDVLRLQEEFFTLARGQTEWTIEVPPHTALDIHTASGDVVLNALAGAVAVETVSGDIKARRTTGTLALQTASGDIQLSDCRGEISAHTSSGRIKAQALDGVLQLATGSGHIKAKDLSGQLSCQAASGSIAINGLRPAGPGFFSTTSGDLLVDLADTPQDNLTLQTASGDALLRYNGAPIQGYFVFYAQVDRGTIAAPFSFDHAEQLVLDGLPYQLKSFTRADVSEIGASPSAAVPVAPLPQIVIRTASGRAELEP